LKEDGFPARNQGQMKESITSLVNFLVRPAKDIARHSLPHKSFAHMAGGASEKSYRKEAGSKNRPEGRRESRVPGRKPGTGS